MPKYSNSEKVSEIYLNKQKAEILSLLNGKDYPFMNSYREKLASISVEQDNYMALKKYIALYDEISSFLESEEYDLKLARYYRSSEKRVTPVNFIIEDYFFKGLFEKYSIPEVGCLTELQDLMRDYFSENAYCKNFTLSYWWWEEAANRVKRFGPFLRGVMKIPDKKLLESVFAFLESCSVTKEEVDNTWYKLNNYYSKALENIMYRRAKVRDDITYWNLSDFQKPIPLPIFSDEEAEDKNMPNVPKGLIVFMYKQNKKLLDDYSIQYILLSCIPQFNLRQLKMFDAIYGNVSFKPKSTYRYVAVIIRLLIEWYEADSKWYEMMIEER